jgi:inosose dehydratase
MTRQPLVGINPLPWFLSPEGDWQLSPQRIEEAAGPVHEAGFDAITIDIPADMTVVEYAALLESLVLRTAPGYFGADFHDAASLEETIERARRHAIAHRALGHEQSFIASNLSPERIARPAVGAEFDRARFDALIEGVSRVVDAFLAEGVTPCLHPHVGSWIETEAEVEEVLAAVPRLSFGPDTGHLFWAGMDPVAIIERHRPRVVSVHLKDSSRADADTARERRSDYFEAASSGVWRELGEGDVDLDGVIAALGTGFAGWYIIEVDVPYLPTAAESTLHSGDWVRTHLSGEESS